MQEEEHDEIVKHTSYFLKVFNVIMYAKYSNSFIYKIY